MNKFFSTFKHLVVKSSMYLDERKWLVLLFLFFSVLVALTEGASILLLIPILDNGGDLSSYTDKDIIGPIALWLSAMDHTERLIVVVSILATILLFRGIFSLFLQYLTSRLPLEILAKISQQTLDLILRTDIAFIHKHDFATLRTYFYELPLNMGSAVKALIDSISKTILLCIYLSIMMVISWKMTLTALILVLALGIGIKWLSDLRMRVSSKQHADSQIIWGNAILVVLLGSSIIRLTNAQPKITKMYEESIQKFTKADILRSMLIGLNAPLITTGAGIFICAIIGVAAFVNRESDTSWMFEIIIFVVTMYRMVPPMSDLLSSTVTISAQLVSFERMENFARQATARTMPNGIEVFRELQKEIRLEGLTFDYDDVSQNDKAEEGQIRGTLTDLNLVIPKGTMLALVGASGAGKTTLASLLCRLYDPKSGSILIDGQDLRSFDVATWRNHVSLVTQDIFLFNDTVLNNIRFGFEDIDIQEVYEAARMAAAIDFIEELPQGWDTQLGENGVRLSGGQKQRISIARAILNNPQVLIMDEATSQLDSVTEQRIQTTVDTLAKGRTVIVIAHRLSTVKHADSIVVMDKGSIIEQGSHDELAAKHGAYWNLLQHQTFMQDTAYEQTEKS
jgi:subfamily B ATP-binding cassette protein MsbA